MKRTYRYNPETKKMEEITREQGVTLHHIIPDREFKDSQGNVIKSRAHLRELNRQGKNIDIREMPNIIKDINRNREHAWKQQKRERLAAIVDSVKGHGL